MQYADYLFDSLISLCNAYYDKNFDYILNKDDKQRDDFLALYKFSKSLLKNIDLFDQKITQRQKLRAEQFFNKKYFWKRVELQIEPRLHDFGYERELQVKQNLLKKKKTMSESQTKLKADSFQLNKSKQKNLAFKPSQEESGLSLNMDEVSKPALSQSKVNQESFGEPKNKSFLNIFGGGGILKQKAEGDFQLQAKELQELWNRFIDRLNIIDQAQAEINREKSALADGIINIKNLLLLSKPEISHLDPIPDFDLIIQRLIVFLMNAINDPGNKLTIIRILQIMKKTVQKEDDPDNQVAIQNKLDNLGTTKMILHLISQNNKILDKGILDELI